MRRILNGTKKRRIGVIGFKVRKRNEYDSERKMIE